MVFGTGYGERRRDPKVFFSERRIQKIENFSPLFEKKKVEVKVILFFFLYLLKMEMRGKRNRKVKRGR